MVWKKEEEEGHFMVYSAPSAPNKRKTRRNEDKDHDENKRGNLPNLKTHEIYDNSIVTTLIRYDTADAETTIEQLFEMKGGIKKVAENLKDNHDFRVLENLQMRFQHWRKLDEVDEIDGDVMGCMVMLNSSGLLSKNRTKRARDKRANTFFEEFHR